MPFASVWIFPDETKRNKVVFQTHPKKAVLSVIVFALQAKYFSKKELRQFISRVEL